MQKLNDTNKIISRFLKTLEKPNGFGNDQLYTGVDLGTAFIVLCVVDSTGNPIYGAYQYANVVRDGMVVDYIGAVNIVKQLKSKIENTINTELRYCASAIPSGMEKIDAGVVKNVCESAGFEVLCSLEEPTAANNIIQLRDGAIVDIGGGTTGISIFKNGKLLNSYDESTGGTHFSLVLSGYYDIPYEEAEELKRNNKNHEEIFPIVKPVIDKVISIIDHSIKGEKIDQLILVGGTSSLTGIENYIQEQINIPTFKPKEPIFVTPLGIAMSCIKKG